MAFMTTMHTEDVALFSNPPYNTAEDKISWTQYKPSYANIGQDGYNSIHFNILGNAAQYIDLSRSKLYVKLRIEKQDGEDWDPDESGLPIDMILHTMWSSVDVTLNNIQVSGAGGNYMYKAAIECLLHYSKNTKDIQLQSIGMSPDTANFDSVKPGDTSDGVNSGLIARRIFFGNDGKGSGDFKGVLLADICNQGRLILDGVDVGITLHSYYITFIRKLGRTYVSPNLLANNIDVVKAIANIALNVNEVCNKTSPSPNRRMGKSKETFTSKKYPEYSGSGSGSSNEGGINEEEIWKSTNGSEEEEEEEGIFESDG